MAISVGIVVAACVFMALARFMPYVTGLFASVLLYFTQDWTKKMVPGHPWMNFITVLVATELIVLAFTNLPKVGKAVTFALSEMFIAMPAEILWKKYFETVGTTGGFRAAYLLIRMALFITAGLVVTISIIRDKDTIDLLA